MSDPKHPPSPTEQPLGEDIYRLICERSGIALVATDADLNIRVWNTAAGRLFGASAKQMIGTPVLSILPAERRAIAERLLRRAVCGREANEVEFSQRDEGGQPRHFAVSIAPVVDRAGNTLGTSMWVRDITRRTQLLKDLIQGRKMAALGEMAGAVAHHFNNILGGMVTSLDFALASEDSAIEHRVLEQTGRSLARATRLVDSLLAFAEGDRRPDDLADLTEVLLNALETIEPHLSKAGIKLGVTLPRMPVAPVPRKQMTTAILTFLHNAMDAMPGGGDLRVDLEHRQGYCLVRFTDTGCGMSEESLDRIFEPFYSTKDSRVGGQERGAGLGLAVAHGIIHEIGGKILVRSRIGAGTTFEIWVPSGPSARDAPPTA